MKPQSKIIEMKLLKHVKDFADERPHILFRSGEVILKLAKQPEETYTFEFEPDERRYQNE